MHPEKHDLGVERTPNCVSFKDSGGGQGPSANLCSVAMQKVCTYSEGPMEQGKGKVCGDREQNTIRWVCLKVRQEALWGSELSVAEGIQVADAIGQLIGCLEGSCKWEHN